MPSFIDDADVVRRLLGTNVLAGLKQCFGKFGLGWVAKGQRRILQVAHPKIVSTLDMNMLRPF